MYEWYSGSDRSEGVPTALAELDRNFFEVALEDRLNRLEGLLGREDDPNWRGYLRFRIALDLKTAGRTEDARLALLGAIQEFEPLAGNLRDVMPQYAGALHWLILDHLWLDRDTEAIADYASIVVANLSESMLIAPGVALTCRYLAGALNRLGHERNLPLLYRLALSLAIRAHHAEPDSPLHLEELIYCYFSVRDAAHCRLAYEMFTKVGPPEDARVRVNEFMRARFHEIGGKVRLRA